MDTSSECFVSVIPLYLPVLESVLERYGMVCTGSTDVVADIGIVWNVLARILAASAQWKSVVVYVGDRTIDMLQEFHKRILV